MSRGTTIALALALALGAASCSSFERDWEAAARAAPAGTLEGRWEGTWLSEVNGHTGALRCLITRKESGAYDARYHATYACCFTFEYSVELEAEGHGAGHKLQGSADLGWLAGGIYRYEATVEGDAFRSTYAAEKDRGSFSMTRVNLLDG